MPIIIENINWTQKNEEIVINVPLKENSKAQKDIFTSENYLKVHAPPFLWEAFLLHPIDENESRCKILKNSVVFTLKKIEEIEWESLQKDISKEEKKEIRDLSIKLHQEKAQKKIKENAEIKDAKKREEIHKEIDRETKQREEIDKLITTAKECFIKPKSPKKEINPKIDETPIKSKMQQKVDLLSTKPKIQPKIVESPAIKKVDEIPPVRKSCTINVTFSKRNFITPKRESMAPAEAEWILKQSEAKRTIGFVDDDLRPEERNPEWLKEKGDTFFKQKNYLAAIAAYSTGIKLTKKYYPLYLNRSAAHYIQGNYQRCAEDCSSALELLDPPLEINRKERASCLARRGAALCKLGLL